MIERKDFDPTNSQSWNTHTVVTDATGHVIDDKYLTDDGTVIDTRYTVDATGTSTASPSTITLPGKTATSAPVILTGAQIGNVFGSSIGQALGGRDPFARIAAGAALSTVGGVVGNTIDLLMNDTTGMGIDAAIARSLDGIGSQLGQNLLNAGVGAVSGFLMMELDKLLGVDTSSFGGQLVNVVGTSVLNQALTNIATGGPGAVFNGMGGVINNLPNAIGGFLGSYLAHQILKAESVYGVVGGNIGGALGAIAATNAILGGTGAGATTLSGIFTGSALNLSISTIADIAAQILVPGLGALFGTLFGTIIGDLFNRPNTTEGYANITFAAGEQVFKVTLAAAGGPEEVMVQDHMNTIGGRVAVTLNDLINTVGGKVVDTGNIVINMATSTRHHDWDYVQASNLTSLGQVKLIMGNDQFNWAVVNEMKALKFEGGNIYIKRALAATPASQIKHGFQQFSNSDGGYSYDPIDYVVNTSAAELMGNIKIAQDYEFYEQNKAVIDALIKQNPNSEFTAGWIITLAKAEEMGLNKFQKTDFDGGVGLFVPAFHIERFGGTLAGTTLRSDAASGKVYLDVATSATTTTSIEIPNFWSLANVTNVGSVADYANSAVGDKWWTSPASGMASFTDLSASNDIIMGGNGTLAILLGNGNNWVHAGNANDSVYAGNGNNVVALGDGPSAVTLGDGNNTVAVGNGANRITAGNGRNTVTAGNGANIITLGGGGNSVTTGNGNNTLSVSVGTVTTGSGNDTIAIGTGTVDSGDGDDGISGGAGNNIIRAGAGNDAMYGGGSFDQLFGGTGTDHAFYLGQRSDYLIRSLRGGGGLSIYDLRSGSPDGIDEVQDVEQFHFANGTFAADALGAVNPYSVDNDFGYDGRSDIFLRNPTTGDLVTWEMYGATVQAANYVTYNGAQYKLNASWKAEGIDDFSGDHKSDVLWRNTNGDIVLWNMNGNAIAATNAVTYNGNGVALNSYWKVAGVNDMSGDGKADILWRGDGGEIISWAMNGAAIQSAAAVTYNGNAVSLNSYWKVAAVADFGADGKSDILWRGDGGEIILWAMNGNVIESASSVTYNGNNVALNSYWKIAGVGDMSGDGKADILWRGDGGEIISWAMNGKAIQSADLVRFNGNAVSLNSYWTVAGVADYSGDGRSDILWRGNGEELVTWVMNTHTITGAALNTFNGSQLTLSQNWVAIT